MAKEARHQPLIPAAASLDRPRRRARLWGFRLAAMIGVPAALFGAVELCLTVVGAGYDPAFLARDEEDPAKWHDNFTFGWRFFPPALSRASQPFRVTGEKPPGTTRILVVGGSAAMGDPEPAYGPARTLKVLLEARHPDRHFEVLNMAVTAINSHVVLPIVRDCMRLQPDVVVIYMGNNEVHGPFGSGTVFGAQAPPLWAIRGGLAAKKTKTGQLLASLGNTGGVPETWGGMEMFVKQRVAWNDQKLERVYSHFASNLRDVIGVASRGGAKVVLGTVAVNLRDSPPFVSLPENPPPGWMALVGAADASLAADRPGDGSAVASLLKAMELTPDHAELHYRLGLAHLQRGAAPEALAAFGRARDLDALRFRADSGINAIIARVAGEHAGDGVLLADAVGGFAEASPGGIPGENLFWEHVHLNFAGSYLLGRILAEKTAESLGLPATSSGDAAWLAQEECFRRLGLTPFHEREVLLGVEKRLRVPPFTGQSGSAERLERLHRLADDLEREMFSRSAPEALRHYEELLARDPGDWMLRKEFAAFLTVGGQVEAALEQRRQITRILPHHHDGYQLLGSLLNHSERWREAEEPLRTAVRLRPDFAPARNSLGITLSRTGREDEACNEFASAVQLVPDYAEAHFNWALVLMKQRKAEEAVDRLQNLLRLRPQHTGAHYELGRHYTRIRNLDLAAVHYEEVARLAPNEPGSWINLGLLSAEQRKTDKAIDCLQKALDLDPGNQLARERLESLKKQGQ